MLPTWISPTSHIYLVRLPPVIVTLTSEEFSRSQDARTQRESIRVMAFSPKIQYLHGPCAGRGLDSSARPKGRCARLGIRWRHAAWQRHSVYRWCRDLIGLSQEPGLLLL